MGTILITGFPPFVGVPHNPSAEVLSRLPRQLGRHRIETALLPVDGAAIEAALLGLYRARPSAVIHTGVAHDRQRLSLETIAVNRLDYRVPDNAGQLRVGEVKSGEAPTRTSRLPSAAIVKVWQDARLPHQLSDSAGTFLCNQTFYLALRHLPAQVPAGFIHLPPDRTLGALLGVSGEPLEVLVEGVLLAALAVARTIT